MKKTSSLLRTGATGSAGQIKFWKELSPYEEPTIFIGHGQEKEEEETLKQHDEQLTIYYEKLQSKGIAIEQFSMRIPKKCGLKGLYAPDLTQNDNSNGLRFKKHFDPAFK